MAIDCLNYIYNDFNQTTWNVIKYRILQQVSYGLTNISQVPKVPGRMGGIRLD